MPNLPDAQQRIKVCFIGLYAYPLFNADCISPFGGSEVRVAMIAKELAHRGNLDVSVIVFDHGQPHIEMQEQVRVISWVGKQCLVSVYPDEANQTGNVESSFAERLKPRLPGFAWKFLQFIRRVKRQIYIFGEIGAHSIWRSDIKTFDEVNADVYITAGNGELTADIVYYCKAKGKKFILLSGSDLDFDPDIKSNSQYVTPYGVNGFLMQYTLGHADAFILQTERQRNLLREHFQRDGVVIRNPVDLTQKFPPVQSSKVVLWVGKSDLVKRPELALKLAKEFPEYDFKFIMSFSNENIHIETLAKAKNLPNVTILPYIPYEQVEEIYAKAGLLVNTSVFEGFPNTFLQAAKYGVPILSLNVDPDGMLTEHGCGMYCHGDFATMKPALAKLMAKDTARECGANGLEYVRKYHDKTVIGRQFEEALLSLFPSTN